MCLSLTSRKLSDEFPSRSSVSHRLIPLNQLFASPLIMLFPPVFKMSKWISSAPSRGFLGHQRAGFPNEQGTSVSHNEPMRSCITHFSWPDIGSCEVPSKPTQARTEGVGRNMCVFLCQCVCLHAHATHFVIGSKCVCVFV